MSCEFLNLQEPNEGPYSDLVVVDGKFLFLSGLVSEDFETGELVPGDIATETRQALKNLAMILERYVEDVMYDIQYTDSANMYKGDEKVTSAGQFGAADVVANVTYVNGEETERTILSSVTLKEPVTEERLRGTKERPTWYPTGTFRWPVSGRVTSYFGGRRSPGGIGSTNHKGTDIGRVGYTSPIYAAKSGTVIVSQYSSSYGNYVVISHGSGNTTLYGHMSSRKVEAGQYVNQGDVIGITGSTGHSTGPHLHFEITENGVRINPLNDGAEPRKGYLTGYTLA